MKGLIKYARNELVFGNPRVLRTMPDPPLRGEFPEGINTGPRQDPTNPLISKKTLYTAVGSMVGYALPAILEARSAYIHDRVVRRVNFKSMMGAAGGAFMGRRLGARR